MRKLLMFALVLGLVSPLAAADKPEKPKQQQDPEAVFKRLDKDGNGSLTLEEFRGKRDPVKAEAAFKRLDKDGNGVLSLDEFKNRGKKKAGK